VLIFIKGSEMIEDIVISGCGFYHPTEKLSNDELVIAYNSYAETYNRENSEAIAKGISLKMGQSSAGFIESASGIRSRYVRDKGSLVDPEQMFPSLPERTDGELSMQAEVCVLAAKEALSAANKKAEEIDAVIVSCSHKQRDFPGIAIEVQNELGISGFAYDMGVACSSATFGIHAAVTAVKAGSVNSVLLLSPEIKSGQFSPTDRSSNFIFGECTTALIIERLECSSSECNFKIQDVSLHTSFSNNIRNNRGAYNNTSKETMLKRNKFFYQNGRSVFKDISKLAPQFIREHLDRNLVDVDEVSRFWLHQANSKLNRKIISTLLNDDDFDQKRAPTILEEFGNVSSAGAVLAFAKNSKDFTPGQKGVLSSFGAGYSIGSVLVERV
jgi:beta-ketodecanoyl-[acyl-carrier-protein] synthase